MRQDRKLNKLIMFASILGLLASIVAIVAGAGVAVYGFLKHKELEKISEIAFFINQEGLNSVQKLLLGGLLKTEYLFLALGSIVAGIGLLVFIFAILGIVWAKKRKIVRRRIALFIFNLIPLAIAGAVATYLVLEFKVLPEMIKYVAYGLGGVFAVIALFNLLGIICARSEKFVSNDNNKYAFDNGSLRDARVNVNNNVKDAQYQPNVYTQNNQGQPVRPVQRPQDTQMRPSQPPMGQRPMARPQGQQQRPIGTRPQMGANAQSTARPVNSMSAQQRPVQRPQTPVQRPQMQNATRPAQPKNCVKCGKILSANEVFCSICGTKVVK